jgi:hypothetical protein
VALVATLDNGSPEQKCTINDKADEDTRQQNLQPTAHRTLAPFGSSWQGWR